MDAVERQIKGARRSPAGRWLRARGYSDDLAQEVRVTCWRQNVTHEGMANRIAYRTAIKMVRMLARREHTDISELVLAQEIDMAEQLDTMTRLRSVPGRIQAIGEKIVAGITLTGAERVALHRYRVTFRVP